MNTTSIAILQTLANASPEQLTYLNAEEGSELLTAGFISVDATQPNPMDASRFLVKLTDAGMQAALTVAPVVNRVPAFTVSDAIPIPEKKVAKSRTPSGETRTPYPFKDLNVGQSFHVAATAENKEPWRTMASNVNAAEKRFSVEAVPQEMVTVERERLVKDDKGVALIGADGKKIYEKYSVTEPKTVKTRTFLCRKVDATDPNGVGARIWRTA